MKTTKILIVVICSVLFFSCNAYKLSTDEITLIRTYKKSKRNNKGKSTITKSDWYNPFKISTNTVFKKVHKHCTDGNQFDIEAKFIGKKFRRNWFPLSKKHYNLDSLVFRLVYKEYVKLDSYYAIDTVKLVETKTRNQNKMNVKVILKKIKKKPTKKHYMLTNNEKVTLKKKDIIDMHLFFNGSSDEFQNNHCLKEYEEKLKCLINLDRLLFFVEYRQCSAKIKYR